MVFTLVLCVGLVIGQSSGQNLVIWICMVIPLIVTASRKPGIIWKTKIGAFYGALDMVSGNGSLLWSAVSMVFKSGEKSRIIRKIMCL